MNTSSLLDRFSDKFVTEILPTDAFTHNVISQLMNGVGSFAIMEHILTDRIKLMRMFQVAMQFSDIKYHYALKKEIDKINEKYDNYKQK